MSSKLEKIILKKDRENRREAKKKKAVNKRLRFMSFIFMTVILFLSIRVLYFKIVHGDDYEKRVIEQQINSGYLERIIKPNRGSILDRYKHSLASSETVYDVIFDVKKLFTQDKKVQEASITIVNEVLGIDKEYLYGLLNDPQKQTRNDVVIASGISKELAKELNDRKPVLVFLNNTFHRTYSNNSVASNLIGFLRAENKWGLENYYDEYLVGTEGRSIRFASDLLNNQTKILKAEHGYTHITTLDTHLQNIAEEANKKIGEKYAPINSSVIMMNPFTGEILSYAQYPNFNLNEPDNIDGIRDFLIKYRWDTFTQEEKSNYLNFVWKDFNVTSTYEPGSIYKPLVVSAALEEGVISESDIFYCGGVKYFGSEFIPCPYNIPHGSQTLEQALANSCNVAMFEIVEKLGFEKYYEYQRDFGFGELTGIDLPHEQSAKTLLHSFDQLRLPIYLATNAMGQGFNCTPIQMINGFASVINGGNLMKPYIVSQVLDKEGKVILENKPNTMRKIISKSTSDQVRKMLKTVISPIGTGRKAVISGFELGGKTGTAQQGNREDEKYAYSFIGYITVDSPEILVLVTIFEPQIETDETPNAAEPFMEIMKEIIKYKGIKPSDESKVLDDLNVNKINVELPNLTGLSINDAIKELNNLSIEFELVGVEGDFVKSQIPIAGTSVSNNTVVYLTIERKGELSNLSTVPDVKGLSLENAVDVLKDAGFSPLISAASYIDSVSVPQEAITNYSLDGKKDLYKEAPENAEIITSVISQNPNPFVIINKGSIVKIKVR